MAYFEETRPLLHLPKSFVRPAAYDLGPAAETIRFVNTTKLVGIFGDPDRPLAVRLAAGLRAGLEGWRPHPVLAPSMVYVPEGAAPLGTDPREVNAIVERYAGLGVSRDWILKEVPRHYFEIPAFGIGQFPVTCSEYAAFCEATGQEELPTTWNITGRFPPTDANTPVCGIALTSAEAYCKWLSQETGRSFHLPSEAQWEYAAAGPTANEFPWGALFDIRCANTLETNLRMATPVGIFPAGASWVGTLDMGGNVEEWTSSRINEGYPGGVIIEDDLSRILGRDYPVCRGGSFIRSADLARCRRRHGPFPSSLYPIGFRLAEEFTNHSLPNLNSESEQ